MDTVSKVNSNPIRVMNNLQGEGKGDSKEGGREKGGELKKEKEREAVQ